MKGQFMLLSSIFVGLMLIGTASTVSELSSQRFKPNPEAYHTHMLETEGERVDTTSVRERRYFRGMVNSLESYRAETEYWGAQDCFNISLSNPSTNLRMNAPDC